MSRCDSIIYTEITKDRKVNNVVQCRAITLASNETQGTDINHHYWLNLDSSELVSVDLFTYYDGASVCFKRRLEYKANSTG